MSAGEISRPLLVVISAPSVPAKPPFATTSGRHCRVFDEAVTCTTRDPARVRRMELTTIFSARRSFGESRGEFLENAVVHGNHYGVLKSELRAKLAEGADVLLNIDVQGAATIRDGAAVTTS